MLGFLHELDSLQFSMVGLSKRSGTPSHTSFPKRGIWNGSDAGLTDGGALSSFQERSSSASSVYWFIDRFDIALFATLEQTHCSLVACDSEWVILSFPPSS